MKKNPGSEYIPKLDDYELPAEYPFDPRKAKPNRFAGRVKLTHPNAIPRGGARRGAGRKPAREPLERHTITLLKSDAKYLAKYDKRLSVAIRKLIAEQKGAP